MSRFDSLLSTPLNAAVLAALQTAAAATAHGAETSPQKLGKISVDADAETTEFKSDTTSSPKQTAPLLDTPQSITVIPAAVIQSTGSTTLTEALRMTPGITFGAGEGGNPVGDRPFVRGYDTQSSTYIDGVRDIGSQSREIFNLEAIEVLKGPGGATAGRGAAGGSLNLSSKAPKAESFYSAALGVGTADYKRATVDSNFALNDSVAFRLNGLYHDADVAGRDAVFNKRWGVAPSLALGMDGDTRAVISYYHLQSDNLPDTGIPYDNPAFRSSAATPARVLQTGQGNAVSVDRSTFYGLTDRDFYKDNADIATVRVEHSFKSGWTLRNTTRYAQTGQDFIWTQPDDSKGNIYYGQLWRRANTRISDVETIVNQTDGFGEFKTGAITHSVAAGLEFSREQGENDAYTVAAGSGDIVIGTPAVANPAWSCGANVGAPGGYNCTSLFNPNPNDPWTGSIVRNHNPAEATTSTKAAYVFDTLTLTPQWLINVGLRFDKYSTETISAINRTVGNAAFGTRTQFSQDNDLVNYQLGVVFKPMKIGSIYASYSTSSTPANATLGQGSESQALNAATIDLDPEKNRNYEVGTKWDVLGNKLSLTAAVFRTETTNARITLQDGTIAMAGDKKIEGVELGFAGNLFEQWQIFGGYTHLSSELSNVGGSGAAFGLQDGLSFPNTPDDSFSLWSTYTVLPNMTVGAGAYYMSKVWGSELNNKFAPSYWRFDAMASYQLTKDLALQLNVQNATDATYFDKAYPTHYLSIAPGRSAVLNLTAKF